MNCKYIKADGSVEDIEPNNGKDFILSELQNYVRGYMDEMIEISLRHMKELFKDSPDFDEQVALENMKSFFPKLKRWA